MEIYIVKNKQQMGPYEIAQITQMLQAGILQKHDLYWHEGMLDWAPVGILIKEANNNLKLNSNISPPQIVNTRNSLPDTSEDVTKKIIQAMRVCLGLCLLGPTLLGVMGFLFSGPFALAAFILGIIILTKGRTTDGIVGIILSILCPLLGWGVWVASLAFYSGFIKHY